ncbi:ABC transporter permease [Limnohabitans sp. 2KL-1]|jgi:polar amino acid transport system permease protein|uniref:amino acid ABC transporter permease n=1 Tax=Limnohabitans sp. 2KL-1 TaxID=1100699 RepID=UPI000D3B9B43|nr:amino acid ABC transporter permease [Limnohabitans sp. 2KL-1]PUE50601.1 ABC transporter permease [Limnohabitans sp. 2KL-1]
MKDFNVMALLLNPEFSSMLLSGLKVTLFVALGSWLLAMSLAIVLLAVRLSPSRMAQRIVEAYISYHRNIPTLVQMMLWYFGIANFLPDAVQAWLAENQAEAVFAVIALGLCQAAYFCEDLRSGFRAIPMGQTEAARALGHSYTGAMRHVLMPQAVRNAVPALVNHSVSLFKNSSLAMAIGAAELTHAVKEMESRTFRAFEAYLIATVIFLIISLLIMAVGSWIERRTALTTAR